MKAITLWQPWASLLACGAKQYETRSWATKYRGRIAIHAAARSCIKLADIDNRADNAAILVFEKEFYENTLPRGCIIATAELVGCRLIRQNPIDGVIHILDDTGAAVCINGYGAVSENEYLFGDWTPGRYAWEFKSMALLPEPIPVKGGQRIWNWNKEDIYNANR